MVKHLAWMKSSYYDLLLLKSLALHLEMLMELSCILLMAPLMVLMMANLWFYRLDKMMDVSWALPVVILMA